MGKFLLNAFRDFALVVLTFMPGLFAYGMVLYIVFEDPMFSYFAGQVIAPLISSFIVVFFSPRFKPGYKVLQALILFSTSMVCGLILAFPGFVDPTVENTIGPIFTYIGLEIAFLFLGKILLDLLFGLFPAALAEVEEDETEEVYLA